MAGNTYLQLVDFSPAPEALYVNSLIVPAGATLDLDGLHVYTRAAEIDGTVLHGTIQNVPENGQLALNASTPGTINAAGQVDDWTFFGRAGQAVTVIVDPGSGAPRGPSCRNLAGPPCSCWMPRAMSWPRPTTMQRDSGRL